MVYYWGNARFYHFLFSSYLSDNEIEETGSLYTTAFRQYDPGIGRWFRVDPMAAKFLEWSPYNFVMNNPINLTDPDGREPIKPFAGTIGGFISFFNSLSSGVGSSQGSTAHLAMLRMGAFKMTGGGAKPANTTLFNTSNGNRYIYTKKGGWIDMSHFMFYAGRAYKYKVQKEIAIAKREATEAKMREACAPGGCYWPPVVPKGGIESIDPIGEAVQEGYMQERLDQYGPTYSAYSYEDLPSDYYGADFVVNYFGPNSDLSFGEQLQNYMNNILKATSPENAPNYNSLPTEYPSKGELPSKQNKRTKPLYVK